MSDAPASPKPYVFVATLVGSRRTDIDHNASKDALKRSAAEKGWSMRTAEWGGAGVDRGRNVMVARFLEIPEATHLLFIDSDIAFRAQDAIALVESDWPVCGCVYPLKEINWELVRAAARAGAPAQLLPWIASGLCANFTAEQMRYRSGRHGREWIEVNALGTGFMCITRAALETFIAHYGPDIEYASDATFDGATRMHMVFQSQRDPADDSPSGGYLSEDYAFCRMWRMLAGQTHGQIHALCDARVMHAGTHSFRACLGLVLDAAGQPRASGNL